MEIRQELGGRVSPEPAAPGRGLRETLSSRVASAHAVTLLVVLQGHVGEGLVQPPDTCLGSQLKDLVIFLGDFAGDTLTLIAGVHAAGTVPATTLDEEAAWPEDGVCSLQLFPDRH